MPLPQNTSSSGSSCSLVIALFDLTRPSIKPASTSPHARTFHYPASTPPPRQTNYSSSPTLLNHFSVLPWGSRPLSLSPHHMHHKEDRTSRSLPAFLLPLLIFFLPFSPGPESSIYILFLSFPVGFFEFPLDLMPLAWTVLI